MGAKPRDREVTEPNGQERDGHEEACISKIPEVPIDGLSVVEGQKDGRRDEPVDSDHQQWADDDGGIEAKGRLNAAAGLPIQPEAKVPVRR